MVELSTIEFRFDVPSMQREELRAYSEGLFDEWEQRLGAEFAVQEYSLRLEIEDDPVVGLAVVAAPLGALHAGIGTYPSFLEGLKAIQGQLRVADHRLAMSAYKPFARLKVIPPRITRRSGVLAQLQQLLQAAKRREIEVEEAMVEARWILGREALAVPEFMRAFADGLSHMRGNPDRIPMLTVTDEGVVGREARDSAARAAAPDGITSPPMKFKVEVWRDSRSGMRRVRISETW